MTRRIRTAFFRSAVLFVSLMIGVWCVQAVYAASAHRNVGRVYTIDPTTTPADRERLETALDRLRYRFPELFALEEPIVIRFDDHLRTLSGNGVEHIAKIGIGPGGIFLAINPDFREASPGDLVSLIGHELHHIAHFYSVPQLEMTSCEYAREEMPAYAWEIRNHRWTGASEVFHQDTLHFYRELRRTAENCGVEFAEFSGV